MVPSIYPLETLHNSLSLKQVDEFLNTVCESSSEAHVKTMKGRRTTKATGWPINCFQNLKPLPGSGFDLFFGVGDRLC